jgi:hypothetical protein
VLGLSLAAGAAAVTVLSTDQRARIAPTTSAVLASDSQTRIESLHELFADSAARTEMPENLVPKVTDARSGPNDGRCIADIGDRTIRKGCDNHGAPDGRQMVVLFGDSHARQWFDAVNEIAHNAAVWPP